MTAVSFGSMTPSQQDEFEQILTENGGDWQHALMIYNARRGIKSGQDSGATITIGDPAASSGQPAEPGQDSSAVDSVIAGARKLIGRKIPSMRDPATSDGAKQEKAKQDSATAYDLFKRLKEPAFFVPAALALMLTLIALSELSIKSALHDTIAG